MGSIQKQAIQNTIISYLGVIIGFVNTIVLQPSMLSAEELGLTRILFSVSLLIATLFPLGLNSFTIKFFPKFRNKENGHNGYFGFICFIAINGYLLIASLVYLFKGAILSKYASSPLFVEYFVYIFPISFFFCFISILNGYCFALFKTSVPSFLNEIFIRLLTMGVICIYFLKIISFPIFIFIFSFSLGIQLLLLIIYILKSEKISLRINWQVVQSFDIKKTTSYIFLLSLAALASMAIRNNIDNILIGSYLNLEQVAIYSVAFLIASMIEVPAGALSKIADPKISDAISRNDFRLIKEVYYKSTRLLMIIGGLLFIGLFINAHELLSLLPGNYYTGENAMIIISISAFFNMATGMNSPIIYYSDKYKQGSFILIGLIAFSILLNVLLIPRLGIEGAAIATGASLFIFNFLKTMIIYKAYQLQPFGKYVLIVFLLMGACIAINYFLPQVENKILDITYRSIVISLVYSVGIYLSKIAEEELDFLKSLFNH